MRIVITSMIIAFCVICCGGILIIIDPVIHSSDSAGRVDHVIVLGCEYGRMEGRLHRGFKT